MHLYITLVDLAGVAGYGPFHFARKFTLAMGISPHRYRQASAVKTSASMGKTEPRRNTYISVLNFPPPLRVPMIERRPFGELPSEDFGWLKARRHFSTGARDDPSPSGWGCMRVWNDEEIAPNAGFALQAHANIEIIIYVREGAVTHRDTLGNEGRIEA